MKGPKILAVASAVDLDFRYGCTPAWWQLWKGLYEAGCDLIVTPYRGRPGGRPWGGARGVALVARGAESDLPRGGDLRARPRLVRAPEGRPLPAAGRGASGGH